MASKNENKGRGQRSKTPGPTSASNPNPTETSPSVSSPTGDATTTSLVPSSAFPSAPPTTTTTTQPLPSGPPLHVQETHQEEGPLELQEIIIGLFGWQLDDMKSMLRSLLGLGQIIMEGSPELKSAMEALIINMEGLRSAITLTEVMLAERKKRHGSGGSCGGSKGGGGSPDSGSGEGDGEGGGVGA